MSHSAYAFTIQDMGRRKLMSLVNLLIISEFIFSFVFLFRKRLQNKKQALFVLYFF